MITISDTASQSRLFEVFEGSSAINSKFESVVLVSVTTLSALKK